MSSSNIRVRVRPAHPPAPASAGQYYCLPIDDLKPGKRQVRKHAKAQLQRLTGLVRRFGQVTPVLIDGGRLIIDGHLLWDALKAAGKQTVQVHVIDHLSEAEVEALRISLHSVMEMSTWDDDALREALEDLLHVEPQLVEVTALPMAKIDTLLLSGFEAVAEEEPLPAPAQRGKSRLQRGDVFVLMREGTAVHRVVCGDAKDPQIVALALAGRQIRMILSDIPYGLVPIKGVVSDKHADFEQGARMTEEEALPFFGGLLDAWTPALVDGGACYLFIDHRAMFVLTQATRDAGLTHICTCVFDKQQGAMGGLYRHQVEFVLVLAKGKRIAINNVQLGKYGRNRTTLWSSAGMAGFSKDRKAALDAHPTVKPTQLTAEAILDVTNRGDVVFDGCMGTGTTIIAADRVGRIGVGIELDPDYFQVAVERLANAAEGSVIHEETGLSLEALLAQRSAEA